jgi:DNA-binding MarR family transcriptional regulator
MTQDNLDKPLTPLLIHIGRLLRERVTSALREGGIHYGQSRILMALLRHGKMTQGVIGSGLNIKPATVTNQVKKMEAAGLINRRQGRRDDRIMNVTLTPKGKKAAKYVASVMAQVEDEICSELTQRGVYALRKPLENVRNTLGGTDPGITGI